ncbi:cyclin-dependent kinases regulatory subunit 1 isoform X1 [Haliaeetus albicilla]|uniref:cyclin-dependent kinases regulatory subunit 1 isoform X1 n=1 Tax=Haliaeetus albicilla TaxID=8969 RepID=UPI0037E73A97
MAHKQIYYSDKYDDEEFEYRAPHPAVPPAAAQEAGEVSGPRPTEAPTETAPSSSSLPGGLHPVTLGAAWALPGGGARPQCRGGPS